MGSCPLGRYLSGIWRFWLLGTGYGHHYGRALGTASHSHLFLGSFIFTPFSEVGWAVRFFSFSQSDSVAQVSDLPQTRARLDSPPGLSRHAKRLAVETANLYYQSATERERATAAV